MNNFYIYFFAIDIYFNMRIFENKFTIKNAERKLSKFVVPKLGFSNILPQTKFPEQVPEQNSLEVVLVNPKLTTKHSFNKTPEKICNPTIAKIT